jgi:DNA topoisomerase-3
VGRTEKAVTGFRGRSGRTFRAKLRLEQQDEGKWRVEFDEEWAKEPPKDADDAAGDEGAAAGVGAQAANSSDQEAAEAPAAARSAGGG